MVKTGSWRIGESLHLHGGRGSSGSYSWTVNYDLRSGKVLALRDLFQPGAQYLDPISNLLPGRSACPRRAWLGRWRAPHAGKLTKFWNITPHGLLVTFDEYQVAAYAAGPQSVTIPTKI